MSTDWLTFLLIYNLGSPISSSSFPDSTLYLAGGEFPDGSASREMWRYDPCFDSWTEMAPMNVARSELGEELSTLFFSHR